MRAGAGKGPRQEYFCPFCNTLCKDQGAHLILQVDYPPIFDDILTIWSCEIFLKAGCYTLTPLQHGSVVCPQPGCSTFLPDLEARRRHLRDEHEGQVLHWTLVQCGAVNCSLLHHCTVLCFILHCAYCSWRGSAVCVETSSPACTAWSCTGLLHRPSAMHTVQFTLHT